jgi:hypothetical protein
VGISGVYVSCLSRFVSLFFTNFSFVLKKWLCHGDYGPTHYSQGDCDGFQFTAGDTLEEARSGATGRNVQRRRRHRGRNIAWGVALTPVVVVGGVFVVASAPIWLTAMGIKRRRHRNARNRRREPAPPGEIEL